jgi:hypothetical protein
MLIDVLNRVAGDSGLDAVQQRTKLLKLLNNAQREIRNELDSNALLREVSVVVMPNNIVALPPMIGDIKGIRQHNTELLVPLQSQVPRYSENTLAYKWRNWRDLGESPYHTTPANIDVITFETSVLEDAIVVVNGKTNVAANAVESVTLDASPKSTTGLFDPAIVSISSVSARTVDITVKDGTDTEIAVLYNNESKTRYKLIDVSELPWPIDTDAGEALIDVLYTLPYKELINDTDVFPAGDIYDEAWYCRAMSLYYRPLANRGNDAANFRALSLVALKNIKDVQERGIEKHVTFGRNKFYDTIRVIDRDGRYGPGYGLDYLGH